MRDKSGILSNNLIAIWKLAIMLVGVMVTGSASAQDYSAATEKRVKFLDTSFQRLDGNISPQNMRYVSGKVTLWKETKGERDWIDVTDAVYNAASYSEIRSEVEISASGGTGVECGRQIG